MRVLPGGMFEKLITVGAVNGVAPRVFAAMIVPDAVVARVLSFGKRHPRQSEIPEVIIEYDETLALHAVPPNKPMLGVIDHHR